MEKEKLMENLQKLVGGYIEPLRLPDGSVLLMNEDGRNLGLDFNMRGPRGEQIVGDIVVLGQHGSEFADCTMEFKTWKYLVDLWR